MQANLVRSLGSQFTWYMHWLEVVRGGRGRPYPFPTDNAPLEFIEIDVLPCLSAIRCRAINKGLPAFRHAFHRAASH